MISVPTYNLQGEKSGKIELAENVFGLKMNQDLVHQVINAQLANSHHNYAHTKGRGDVRGGGVKPWRQKGTGRARHGSIRSPLWRGGGVVFGPRSEKIYAHKVNKKAKKKALFMVLSSKLKDNELTILDELKINEPKTKSMASLLGKIFKGAKKPKVLVAINKKDDNILRAAKNLPDAKIILANSLNVMDILSFKYFLLDREGVKIIEKTYGSI
jgi:large subunit ribosomal protein L4